MTLLQWEKNRCQVNMSQFRWWSVTSLLSFRLHPSIIRKRKRTMEHHCSQIAGKALGRVDVPPTSVIQLHHLTSYVLGWFSNSMGTSFDDRKARGKDKTRLPVPNLTLSHWSSQLFDLRAPSSTDVSVLLLNQPIIRGVSDSKVVSRPIAVVKRTRCTVVL